MIRKMSSYLLKKHMILKNSQYEYRKRKIQNYINKRYTICNNIILNLLVSVDIHKIIQWYDLFMDYSTMEVVDEEHFFIILKQIDMFRNINTDIILTIFRIICTTYTNRIIIHEFIVFLLLFHDPSEYFITLQKDFINQFIQYHDIDYISTPTL